MYSVAVKIYILYVYLLSIIIIMYEAYLETDESLLLNVVMQIW